MPPSHEIHILHRLRGSALQQIVKTRDQDQSQAIRGELKPKITEIRPHDILNLRELR